MSVDLDQFESNLHVIPELIKETMTKLRDLDLEQYTMARDIDRDADKYLRASASGQKQPDEFQRISAMFVKQRQIKDQRVKLSEDLCKFLDRKVNKLKQSLDKLKKDIEEREAIIAKSVDHHKESTGKTIPKDVQKSSGSSYKDSNKPTEKRKKGDVSSSDEDKIRGATRKQRIVSESADEQSNDLFEMPIDPNEPVYCYCKQVSFGNMVACDGEDCLIEWFHFECVSLKATPKGKWYCPECREKYKRK